VPPIRPETYIVQPEDTLYSIAWRFDLNFNDLAAWNDLGAGYRLEPGQILLLRPTPGVASRPRPPSTGGPAAASAPASTSQPPRPNPHRDIPRVEKPRPLPDLGPNPAAVKPSSTPPVSPTGSPAGNGVGVAGPTGVVPAAPSVAPGGWMWPTRALGSPTAVAGGGLMIKGGLGQDVVAASTGKVVYVGSGLRGYGNLVIIKHSESLLSAYAHNREVAVKEGQSVKAGERIGAMGLGPRQIPALYFEIRLNGRPVPVRPYLDNK
jgi:lipoprotein NlpD